MSQFVTAKVLGGNPEKAYMFKRPFSENSLIAVTFLLVVALAYPAFNSLMDDHYSPDAVETVTGEVSRTVASVQEFAPSRADILSTAEFDLSCSGSSQTDWDVSENYIQFSGRNCLSAMAAEQIEIVNQSNGYTASVFFLGSNNYKTDLIQLVQGENEIAFRYKARDGKATERILKVRALKI